MSELQPCPFCGEGNAHLLFWEQTHTVACLQCLAKGPETLSAKAAIRRWNKRAVQANSKAEPVEEMQEDLE